MGRTPWISQDEASEEVTGHDADQDEPRSSSDETESRRRIRRT
jgi:hypothetical protein